MPTITRDRPDRIRPAPEHRPPPASPLRAALAHPLLTIAPIVLLVAAAILISQGRSPTYTAESRVAIGSFSPSQQDAPGAAYAGTQFAAAYSRAITAQDVVGPVARATGLAPGEVAGRLTATPIPDSPLLRISGKGPSAASAVKLTDAATSALLSYVRRSDITGARANDLLARYRAAQADFAAARTRVRHARRNSDHHPSSDRATRSLERAQTTADAADLRARALRESYLQQAQSETSGIPVRTLNAASAAASNRERTLKLLVTIGALVGLAVGVALATARATRRA
jgi:capsular polysaccharide biosynthesis protein